PFQLHGERRGRDLEQGGARLGGELHRAGRGRGAPGGGAGRVGDLRLGPELRQRRRLDDPVGVLADAVDLDLDLGARGGRARARRGAGEDDVAGLEGDEAGEVGDQEAEGEEQVGGVVFLLDLAIDLDPDRQVVEVDAL